jgi:hypothetical protein
MMSIMDATKVISATCCYCGQPMDEGIACTWLPEITVGGALRPRLPCGPEDGLASCHDCNTPQGALHHPGCCAERCPGCLGQAIACGCEWT